MGKISLTVKGDYAKTKRFLQRVKGHSFTDVLDYYGKLGVLLLSDATPVDSGKTASSWYYGIDKNDKEIVLYWGNTNESNHVNIAIILQYGHGTGTGGYVQGRDYINPAMQTVFDELADKVWKEVTRS